MSERTDRQRKMWREIAFGDAHEAFLMFESMLASMRETTSMVLSHVELRTESSDDGQNAPQSQAPARLPQKVARNAPCPCGSGKKYKHCCGAIIA